MVTNFDRVKRRSVIGLCCVKHEIKANIYIRGGMRNEARIKAIKYGNKTKTSKDVQNCKLYTFGTETLGIEIRVIKRLASKLRERDSGEREREREGGYETVEQELYYLTY